MTERVGQEGEPVAGDEGRRLLEGRGSRVHGGLPHPVDVVAVEDVGVVDGVAAVRRVQVQIRQRVTQLQPAARELQLGMGDGAVGPVVA